MISLLVVGRVKNIYIKQSLYEREREINTPSNNPYESEPRVRTKDDKWFSPWVHQLPPRFPLNKSSPFSPNSNPNPCTWLTMMIPNILPYLLYKLRPLVVPHKYATASTIYTPIFWINNPCMQWYQSQGHSLKGLAFFVQSLVSFYIFESYPSKTISKNGELW